MRVLSLGTDRKLFDTGSAVYARHRQYAHILGNLQVVVFTRRGKYRTIHDDSLHIHPTNSRSRLRYGLDALLLARTLPKPDVITVQDPFETGLVGVLLSRLWHVPLHVQVHTDFLAEGFAAHSRLNRVRLWLARFVFKRAARVRVVSARIADGIKERYKLDIPISVLPIFVDVNRFLTVRHAAHPRFEASLLFVGRLEAEKRADIAIRTLARVRSLGIVAGLTILGDGSLQKQLEQFAEKQEVSEWVNFVGHQDPLPHYAHADIVLVPSEYEGYGLVIVEALAAGVPVMATPVGVAEESGAIIAPHDSDAFAGELCALFARPELPKGRLLSYPYRSEEEYMHAWASDIAACVMQG